MTSLPATPVSGPAATALPAQRRLRASDADRAAVVARLQQAVGHGLLTLDEGDERMAAAWSARYVDELRPLSADLPAPVPPGPAVPGWRALGEGLAAQVRHELRTTSAAGVRSRRFVLSAVAVGLVVLLVLAFVAALLHGLAGPVDHQHPFFDRGR